MFVVVPGKKYASYILFGQYPRQTLHSMQVTVVQSGEEREIGLRLGDLLVLFAEGLEQRRRLQGRHGWGG